MLRRFWKPVAATALFVGTPTYLYYRYYSKQRANTVEIPVRLRGEDGKPMISTRTFPMLSQSVVNERLHEHAKQESLRRGGTKWCINTASVAANDPIEDAHAHAIVARDPDDPLAPGDWLFFAVMDGHAGPHTSRLLSKTLINAIVLELSNLINDKKGSRGFWRSTVQGPDTISLAIQKAFTKLDEELISAPLKLLGANFDKEDLKSRQIPDLSQHPLALPLMLPAISGSCALMAVFDTAKQDLYVACSGDSRAVAGVWEEDENGNGLWRVEVLSEDQTGRNPMEHKRIQSEHPPDEAEDVIVRGRVLGGLEPTRAFGDARYKWPREVQDVLNTAFLVGNNKPLRPPPTSFKTPPYVTATPVVTHRALSFTEMANGFAQPKSSAPRFIVLATDGLWDRLTSEEVVSLVGGALQGLTGTVSRSELCTLAPTSSGSVSTVEGKGQRLKDDDHVQANSWSFGDDNLGVHLIRNAFGGGDQHALRRLMSIPYPHARRYRDDTTVTVVVWKDEDGAEDVVTASAKPGEEALNDSKPPSSANDGSNVKAKL
ncbi:phosphatase 2C-like domain-containing protein [Pisolithus croceorrhizus]|nr:phosphatase 2C-like domain-containing protein [Pisolithus croceorrhizus]KAI6163143.1 phosphatase 2C-like domain-containing protein [Pisolithus thermaeus]